MRDLPVGAPWTCSKCGKKVPIHYRYIAEHAALCNGKPIAGTATEALMRYAEVLGGRIKY